MKVSGGAGHAEKGGVPGSGNFLLLPLPLPLIFSLPLPLPLPLP